MGQAGTRGPEPRDRTDEVVGKLREHERPFMGTGELAEAMGYDSNPGVKTHLDRAEEMGKIQKASVGQYNIWYLPNLIEEHEISDSGAPPVADGGLLAFLSGEDWTRAAYRPAVLLFAILTAGVGYLTLSSGASGPAFVAGIGITIFLGAFAVWLFVLGRKAEPDPAVEEGDFDRKAREWLGR